MGLCGTGKDHCCYFDNKPCEFVAPTGREDFKWKCTLREDLGSWDKVHKDSRYKANVLPLIEDHKVGCHCGDWPDAVNGKCTDCKRV